MIKLFKVTFTKKEVILVSIVFFITPFITGLNSESMVTLVYGHYIPTVLNVVFLLLCYKKYCMINDTYLNIATRLKSYKVLLYSMIFALCSVFLYSFALDSYIFMINGVIEGKYLEQFIIFSIYNIMQLLISQAFLLLQIGNKKSFIYISIAIMINFIFHYWVVPLTI